MVKRTHRNQIISVIILCLALFSSSSRASAQSGKSIQISLPDSSAYPTITIYIDPEDRDGSPLEDVQIEQISLFEDDLKRDILEFQALSPGVQLVTALNFSSPFAIQDVNGRSRFDFIKESLLNWAAQPMDPSQDDLSILDNLNLEQVHLEEKGAWIKALEELDPELREVEADFSILARAIEIASDPITQPGMKRVVLFFTPQPPSDRFEAIDNLSFLAQDNQVMVYTVLISSPAFFETAGADKLRSLSENTGGKFLTFSGEEPLADPGQLLQPLRSTYLLKYRSSIVTSGNHTLEVSISSTPTNITGSREFTLDIQPPNPIFITPPRSITRTPIEDQSGESEEIRFEPASQLLPILVEFPDLHPRELEELIFRVDGEIIETKTSPPYDQFIWDLERYEISGTHTLTLEAVDEMGLSRISVETPIEVQVIQPAQNLGDIAMKNGPALLALAIILLVGLVLVGLISRGTIRPGNVQLISWIKIQGSQAVGFIKRVFSSPGKAEVPSQEQKAKPYRLVPVSDLSQRLFAQPIQIDQPEITLGSANREGLIRIQHSSIIPEHARITAMEGDLYQITDFGSTAGTWINYHQIPPSTPHLIKDGDIINIGEAAFRFQIKTRPDFQEANEENKL